MSDTREDVAKAVSDLRDIQDKLQSLTLRAQSIVKEHGKAYGIDDRAAAAWLANLEQAVRDRPFEENEKFDSRSFGMTMSDTIKALECVAQGKDPDIDDE